MPPRTTPYPNLVIQTVDPRATRRRWLALALVWTLSLAGAAGAAWFYFLPTGAVLDPAVFEGLKQDNERLQQRVAVLERADQVDRVAGADLQRTLREREEEIAGLRTDLAFYGRLVGGGARREGLSVHSVHVTPVKDSRAWNVTITLTQNMKRSQVSDGQLQISIDGVAQGQLKSLPWTELAGDKDNGGLPFSFKYFQQVSGTVMLPDGFSPNRIKVVADASGGGGRVEQGFAWEEARATEETNNVQQQEKSDSATR